MSPTSIRGLASARTWQAPAPAIAPVSIPSRRRNSPLQLRMREKSDVTAARRDVRAFANQMGFDGAQCALIVAVVSEIGRTLVGTEGGELCIRTVRMDDRRGIQMEAAGGEREVDLDNLGRGSSMTMVRRFADELELAPRPGGGARVKATKWLR